jgi:hypothetical protein
VHDLQIQARMNDLVVGTHGRGAYVLDDLSPLEHLAQAKEAQVAYLFPIRDELDFQPNATRNSGMGTSGFSGQNPELGAGIAYTLNDIPSDAKANIQIVDASGTVIRQMAAHNKPGMFRQYWDMRVGPPLTGPVTDTLPPGTAAAGGRGGRGGGGGGAGGGRGGNAEAFFQALPGTYKARLTVASASGPATVLEQSFTLRKDPMVTLTESEMKQLNAFRVSVASFQRTYRERQAQADTAARKFADVRRVADSSMAKLTPDAKAKIAALTKEFADIVAQVGRPPAAGGRGGFGGGAGAGGGAAGGGGAGGARGGRGGAGGGRAGGGRGAAPTDSGATSGARAAAGAGAGGAGPADDQNGPPAPPSATTVQARFNALTEMLNVSFAVTDDQRKTIQALPADLQKQMDRVTKLEHDELPALIKALKDAGIEVKAGGNN